MLRMNLHVDQFLSFSEKFSSQHSDCGSTITNFVVLGFGNIFFWTVQFKNRENAVLLPIKILAAGLSTKMDLRMVAPSLVTVIESLPGPGPFGFRILSFGGNFL